MCCCFVAQKHLQNTNQTQSQDSMAFFRALQISWGKKGGESVWSMKDFSLPSLQAYVNPCWSCLVMSNTSSPSVARLNPTVATQASASLLKPTWVSSLGPSFALADRLNAWSRPLFPIQTRIYGNYDTIWNHSCLAASKLQVEEKKPSPVYHPVLYQHSVWWAGHSCLVISPPLLKVSAGLISLSVFSVGLSKRNAFIWISHSDFTSSYQIHPCCSDLLLNVLQLRTRIGARKDGSPMGHGHPTSASMPAEHDGWGRAATGPELKHVHVWMFFICLFSFFFFI